MKAKIHEHQEATERQRKRSHFEYRQPFWLKNIEESAQAETNVRGKKMVKWIHVRVMVGKPW